MPDLLVVSLHVKNPVLVHSSVLLNLADQHRLFFQFLASSGQQPFKTTIPFGFNRNLTVILPCYWPRNTKKT